MNNFAIFHQYCILKFFKSCVRIEKIGNTLLPVIIRFTIQFGISCVTTSAENNTANTTLKTVFMPTSIRYPHKISIMNFKSTTFTHFTWRFLAFDSSSRAPIGQQRVAYWQRQRGGVWCWTTCGITVSVCKKEGKNYSKVHK